jgi:hypothetical protein
MINKYGWIFSCVLAFIMLLFHSFSLFEVTIDSTSIMLLVILLISPHVASFTKVKYGDFEAEISRKEVETIRDETPPSNRESKEYSEHYRANELTASIDLIKSLANTDYILALAKLRMELEKVIRRYHRLAIRQNSSKSMHSLLNELAAANKIEAPLIKSINDIVAVCNRAIHGDVITQSNANIILESGTIVLDDLFWDLEFKVAHGEVISKELIEAFDFESLYYNKKYQLTSVIASLHNPEKFVRILTQEQLSDFLEGYNEYGEFIVDLRAVDDNSYKLLKQDKI